MQFSAFDWPIFDPRQGIRARLGPGKPPSYPNTVIEPLVAAARSCGLQPESGYVWAVVRQIFNKRRRRFHIAIIGDIQEIRMGEWFYTFPVDNPEEAAHEGIARQLYGDKYADMNTVTMQAWYTILKPINSPLEMHQKYEVGETRQLPIVPPSLASKAPTFRTRIGPRTALLNANFENRSDLRTVWELHELLHHLQSDVGRPKGTTAYSEDKISNLVAKVESLKNSGKVTTLRQAAAIVFETDPDAGYKMYRRYKKRFVD